MVKSLLPRRLSFIHRIKSAVGFLAKPWSQLVMSDLHHGSLEERLRRLELSQTIYLGDHEALTRLHTGHRIYVDTRDVGIASHIMLEGRWEPWIETVLVEAIKPGMRFVDVGANFGYFTLIGAERVGAAGHVYALEANPLLFEKLAKSIAVNGFNSRVSAFNVAVNDDTRAMEILFQHTGSGGGWTDIPRKRSVAKREVLPVNGEPLDKLLGDIPDVQVMKIDVEGAEPKVLAGAKALMARSKRLTIILEFDVRRRMAQTPLDYLESFEYQGFRLSIAAPAGLIACLSPSDCLARLGTGVNYLLLSR